MTSTRILFVCLGNICRSPLAEGAFRHTAQNAGLEEHLYIDSAGTGAWHIGSPPDKRAQQTALEHGIDISNQKARQIHPEDFHSFDFILAMDKSNYEALIDRAPPDNTAEIRMFLEFAPGLNISEVPDPYYGGAKGFTHVFELVTAASNGLITAIQQKNKTAP